MREKIFICSRIGAKTKKQFNLNIKNTKKYARALALVGYDPEATSIYYCSFLDDFKPEERMLGQHLGRERLLKCDRMIVIDDGDKYSEGMLGDIKVAQENNIRIEYIRKEDILKYLNENDLNT